MTLILKVNEAGTQYVKIDATNIDRIQGETSGRKTNVCMLRWNRTCMNITIEN